MKLITLFVALVALTLPVVCLASEKMFFSAQGKYTLSPEYILVISLDETSRMPMATISYTSGGGNGVGLMTAQPTDPFLVYWDSAIQILWWGTARSIGYLDVHVLRSSKSGAYARMCGPVYNYNHVPGIPAVFTAELDRIIPDPPQ